MITHSKKLRIIFFFFILMPLIFTGCFAVKSSSTKSAKNYFETFFVGEEGTQYFINPILFKEKKTNDDLILDLTFRYRNELKDSAIVNFSIKSPIIYKTIDSLIISNHDTSIESNKLELLFNEKNNTGFTSRYSTRISLSELKQMFNHDSWELIIYNQSKMNKYIPNKKTVKAINALRDNVFIIM